MLFRSHYDYKLSFYPDAIDSQLKIALMQAVLSRFKEDAMRKNVTFLVLIQPASHDITTNIFQNYEFFEHYYSEYERSRLTRIVEDICMNLGLHYINFFDVFNANNPNDLYFQIDDDHWNDKGQALAAERVSEYLIQNNLLGF